MSSGAYSRGILRILDGTIDLQTSELKVGIAKASYTPNPDEADLTTFAASEADCDGYDGGFGGTSRQVVRVRVFEEPDNSRIIVKLGNTIWQSLGGNTPNLLGWFVLMYEVFDDTDSIPVAYLQFAADRTTDGTDILAAFDHRHGNLRWNL